MKLTANTEMSMAVVAERDPYPGKNGSLTFSKDWTWLWAKATIYGGPFAQYRPTSETSFGINLREVKNREADHWLPIDDFSVPADKKAVDQALKVAIEQMAAGSSVYAGCMGGWGRTGLFLALVAKAMGEENPVEFVRKNYTPRAVETDQQYKYVKNFDVTEVAAFAKTTFRRAALRKNLPTWLHWMIR